MNVGSHTYLTEYLPMGFQVINRDFIFASLYYSRLVFAKRGADESRLRVRGNTSFSIRDFTLLNW
jgi:hypothetical protein